MVSERTFNFSKFETSYITHTERDTHTCRNTQRYTHADTHTERDTQTYMHRHTHTHGGKKREDKVNKYFLTFASNCKDGKASGIDVVGCTAVVIVEGEATLEPGTSKGPHGTESPAIK